MWKGQFGVVKQTQMAWDFDAAAVIRKPYEVSRRVGTWTHYDRDGTVLGTVTYEWK